MEEEEDDASLFITSGSNTTIDSGVLSVDSCVDVELCLFDCLGVAWVDVDALLVMLLVGGVEDPDDGASAVEFGVDSDGLLP